MNRLICINSTFRICKYPSKECISRIHICERREAEHVRMHCSKQRMTATKGISNAIRLPRLVPYRKCELL